MVHPRKSDSILRFIILKILKTGKYINSYEQIHYSVLRLSHTSRWVGGQGEEE